MKPITIILTDGFSDWEIATLAGVGRAFYGADIRFTSPEGGPILSVAGLEIADTQRFAAPSDGVVVVCGGPLHEKADGPDLSVALQEAQAKGSIIAGICGGTVALARAGLLDEVAHTSNGPGYLQTHARDYRGANRYCDQPMAVRDGGIITAAAPAPASFAAEVLAAAGLEPEKAEGVRTMLAAEHQR